MALINPPTETPRGVTHRTFHSKLIGQEIGYNIYLPSDYDESGERYPVVYHLHGWKGNESSEIWPVKKVCRSRRAITVFVNGTADNGWLDHVLPIESITITELIPYIDERYRTNATRESRMLSGFSMGGAGAFYYAVKYPELFSSVTAYAGTYHHFYHKDYRGVGEPPEKAAEWYETMMRESKYFEEGSLFNLVNILNLIKQNVERIRGKLYIALHIGTADILFCDNEILRLYLNSLNIPHEYKTFEGVGHELEKITEK